MTEEATITGTMTLAQIRETVKAADEKVNYKDPAFRAGVILLSICEVGADPAKLKEFTKFSLTFIKSCVKNLRENKVIQTDALGIERLAVNWENDLAFWCDVNVALGRLSRTSS